MKRKAIALVILAAAAAGTALAFNYDDQDRRDDQRREREVRRERPRVHPLGMALELQKQLGLHEEQVMRFEDMWAEYGDIREETGDYLEEIEDEIRALQREARAAEREFHAFERELSVEVFESLEPDQREMLRNHMREADQRFEREGERERDFRREREGGQEREFAQFVAELRAMVEAGEITGNEAEESIDAMRRHMAGGSEGERDVARKPKNPIGRHPMAYALEGQRKLGLNEEQVKRLQDAWSEIYAAGVEIGGGMRELERHAAELREAGEWNDRTAQEVNAHSRELQAHLEELHEHASEILRDTLNKDQINALEELMAASRGGEGRLGRVNPMHGHSMAWALELHVKLGLNEKQVATLKEAYSELRNAGEELIEAQVEVQRHKAELQETGNWTDRTAREINIALKQIGMAREAVQAKASEIVADTLTKAQVAQLKRIIAENGKNDG